ncbi:hypothetical protein J2X97_000741 [Epilithonimonas hungarica]|nr:hypothetical protein [Epilithonimonas hungarica]
MGHEKSMKTRPIGSPTIVGNGTDVEFLINFINYQYHIKI